MTPVQVQQMIAAALELADKRERDADEVRLLSYLAFPRVELWIELDLESGGRPALFCPSGEVDAVRERHGLVLLAQHDPRSAGVAFHDGESMRRRRHERMFAYEGLRGAQSCRLKVRSSDKSGSEPSGCDRSVTRLRLVS